MKCASVPSVYMNVMLRVSVRTGRNFSPARKVLSITLPSVVRLSFVRTNAGPLPGLTCWNSTILKIVPSTSMWVPFLNWLVEITAASLALPLRAQVLEQRLERGGELGPAALAQRAPIVGLHLGDDLAPGRHRGPAALG